MLKIMTIPRKWRIGDGSFSPFCPKPHPGPPLCERGGEPEIALNCMNC